MGGDPSYPGFIEELCIALAHRWEPERLFMIITAYFDESGTHAGSPNTVVSATMANTLQWSRFERKLRRAKKDHGFQVFHTKKIKDRKGDFKGWSVERRMALIRDLGAITDKGNMDSVTLIMPCIKLTTSEKISLLKRALIPNMGSAFGFALCT
jgi:Protein of unknown function (DUF3800)